MGALLPGQPVTTASVLAVARNALGMTHWFVWIAVSGLLVLAISLTFADLTEDKALLGPLIPLVVFAFLLFTLIAINLRQLRLPLTQRLIPGYPHSHGAAVLLFFLVFCVLPSLFFLRLGFLPFTLAISTTILTAAACLFYSVSSWRIRIATGVLVAGLALAVSNFALILVAATGLAILVRDLVSKVMVFIFVVVSTIALSRLQLETQEVVVLMASLEGFLPWLSLLFLGSAALFFRHWFSVLTVPACETGQKDPVLDGLRRIVDLKPAASTSTRSAKTGYLLSPGFMKVQHLRDRPHWWWLRFGLWDPGENRSNWVWMLLALIMYWVFIPSLSSWWVITITTVWALKSPLREPWLRRLYLQSPLQSRRQFLQQYNYLGYVSAVLQFGGLIALVSILEYLFPRGHHLPAIFLASAAAYCLGRAASSALSLYTTESHPSLKLLITVPVVVLAFYGYMRTADGSFPITGLALAVLVFGLIMQWTLTIWSRSDIELHIPESAIKT